MHFINETYCFYRFVLVVIVVSHATCFHSVTELPVCVRVDVSGGPFQRIHPSGFSWWPQHDTGC